MFFLLLCVSGLWPSHGYHYSYPTPPSPVFTATPSLRGHESRPPTSFQQYSWHTQWEKYQWNKNDNSNGASQMGQKQEMFPPSDRAKLDEGSGNFQTTPDDVAETVSKPNEDISDNFQTTLDDVTKPVSTDKDHGKKNYTTTTTPRPPPMSRPPQMTRPPSGPEPGTMSQPVPTLGNLYAPSLQWHVGIYTKRFTPYMQVCGGSLVRADVVLSAAHCFWDDDVGALSPGLFAVAAGKLHRPWETEGESYTQHADIKDIKIPPRFQGVKTSFQDDIAIVLLSTPLEYAPGVKPICVSFDLETEKKYLMKGNLGTIAGWGLTMPNGPPSQRLNYLKLPYVEIEECIRTADPSFLKYITSDKICAGDQKTGRALCRGDSGGGLVYSRGVPYLAGVASTAPRDDNDCNAYAVATFTYIRAHSAFLMEHVPDIEEGCEKLYENRTETVQNGTLTGVTQTPNIQDGAFHAKRAGKKSRCLRFR